MNEYINSLTPIEKYILSVVPVQFDNNILSISQGH